MSGLKNSPFGKRFRSQHQDSDDEQQQPRRNRPRINPTFAVSDLSNSIASTPSLTRGSSRASTSDSAGPSSPESKPRAKPAVLRDRYDRFVPSRDGTDIRTNYNLLDEGGPHTPSKGNKLIPSESDALREQANNLFTSILHCEVAPADLRPSSPVRNAVAGPSGAGAGAPATPTKKRLLTFNSPAAANPCTPSRRMDTTTDDAYSLSPVRSQSRTLLQSPRRTLRNVSKTPYRVLDAPDLADDFYLNLVDWSSTNMLGVGLGSCVYLWTAHTAAVNKLCDFANQQDTISSVSWSQKGTTLAIGTFSGKLHIYDANTLQLQRTYVQAHQQRIGALAWNSHILSSGSRDRMVHHRDVREPSVQPMRRCVGHRQEVCGLRWSSDTGGGALLASGGNDNKVCIWDLRGSRRPGVASGATSAPSTPNGSARGIVNTYGMPAATATSSVASTTPTAANVLAPANGVFSLSGVAGGVPDELTGDLPLLKFHEHTAAVKALAWDPHVSGVLATGGGTQDKTIRFWNMQSDSSMSVLETGSQVCNLTWSLTSHELVSTHGFSSHIAQNQICIWKYPSLSNVASLTAHTHRVLYLAMSPDGETIVTGAGDETLRFWSAFPKKDDKESKGKVESKLVPSGQWR